MLQAPVDRPVIQEYFKEQSSILESQFNNNNPHSNDHDDTTVPIGNNNDNDFPMQFDTTTADTPPQPDFSSTHFNEM